MIYALIPAFNEADRLGPLVRSIPSRILQEPVSVVVVCDGSTDGTCRVAEACGAEVVKLERNSGKGAAIRAGAELLRSRSYRVMVTMDGDGQHRPSELASLIGPVLNREADVTIGSRYMIQPERGSTPFDRYLVRSVFTRILKNRLNQPVSDPFSGFRCMTREAFESVVLRGDRYEGELEVRFEAERQGLDVREIPIDRIYGGGQSKMSETIGRLGVIRSYVVTVIRKTRELPTAKEGIPVG